LLFTTELFVSFLSNCFIFFVRSKIYQILVTKLWLIICNQPAILTQM
jgi:hypothetical protein